MKKLFFGGFLAFTVPLLAFGYPNKGSFYFQEWASVPATNTTQATTVYTVFEKMDSDFVPRGRFEVPTGEFQRPVVLSGLGRRNRDEVFFVDGAGQLRKYAVPDHWSPNLQPVDILPTNQLIKTVHDIGPLELALLAKNNGIARYAIDSGKLTFLIDPGALPKSQFGEIIDIEPVYVSADQIRLVALTSTQVFVVDVATDDPTQASISSVVPLTHQITDPVELMAFSTESPVVWVKRVHTHLAQWGLDFVDLRQSTATFIQMRATPDEFLFLDAPTENRLVYSLQGDIEQVDSDGKASNAVNMGLLPAALRFNYPNAGFSMAPISQAVISRTGKTWRKRNGIEYVNPQAKSATPARRSGPHYPLPPLGPITAEFVQTHLEKPDDFLKAIAYCLYPSGVVPGSEKVSHSVSAQEFVRAMRSVYLVPNSSFQACGADKLSHYGLKMNAYNEIDVIPGQENHPVLIRILAQLLANSGCPATMAAAGTQ